MIANIRKNCIGTVSFDGQFQGMRKPQDFTVYPVKAGEPADSILIQSGTRIGTVDLQSGHVKLSRPHASGAYFMHLREATFSGKLEADELLLLKGNILATAHGKAGTNGVVFTDNSGALEVFA